MLPFQWAQSISLSRSFIYCYYYNYYYFDCNFTPPLSAYHGETFFFKLVSMEPVHGRRFLLKLKNFRPQLRVAEQSRYSRAKNLSEVEVLSLCPLIYVKKNHKTHKSHEMYTCDVYLFTRNAIFKLSSSLVML